MHNSTANISEMVTDRGEITIVINRKSHIRFQFGYLFLTMAHSNDQGHAHIHYKYLGNVDRLVHINITITIM